MRSTWKRCVGRYLQSYPGMRCGERPLRVSTAVPHQVVHQPTEIDLPLVDLSHLSAGEAKSRAVKIATDDARWAYDLARRPSMRARLIRITDGDHRLYLAMHHLSFDGVTLQRVLLPELIAAYRAYVAGQALLLPKPEAQYSDYTIWQRDWLSGPISSGQNRAMARSSCRLDVDTTACRPPAARGTTVRRRDNSADDRSRHR